VLVDASEGVDIIPRLNFESAVQQGDIARWLRQVGQRELSVGAFWGKVNPRPPPPPPPLSPFLVSSTAPPAFGIYEEDDPLQVGALRPWELVAVAASLLGAAAFAAYLACICRRRFCTDMDDDAPAEGAPLMRDAGPEMKVRQTPVYAASTLVSPDRKPAAAEKPRSMLKWDGKLKQWVKHEVLGQPQTATAPEKKRDDLDEDAHLLQLARTAFGASRPGTGAPSSSPRPPRPSQPDPSIPPPPPRHLLGSPPGSRPGTSEGSPPGPPSEMPRFRKRRLPLKPAAVELMSVEGLAAALDSRGVNREDCFTRDELVDLLKREACLTTVAGVDARTLDQPDMWF